MKVLHSCLFWVNFWIIPQVWFIVFISTSTSRHQVFFGRPFLCLPSGVQCKAVRVTLDSFLSTCPIQIILVMMVSVVHHGLQDFQYSIPSISMCEKRRACWDHWQLSSNTDPYNGVVSTQLWYSFNLIFLLYIWDLQTVLNILKVFFLLYLDDTICWWRAVLWWYKFISSFSKLSCADLK